MKSLDPRVNRLNIAENNAQSVDIIELEQWQTYEVFHQKNAQETHKHVGAVHACNIEMAFLFAKEQYARRLQCINIWVVKTASLYAYNVERKEMENFTLESLTSHEILPYTVFYQHKRGAHPQYVGEVNATNAWEAIQTAQKTFMDTPFMIWVGLNTELYKQPSEETEMYAFVHKKSYRDATGYKVMAKLNKIRKAKKENKQQF